mgnify:CR=1 FL=1
MSLVDPVMASSMRSIEVSRRVWSAIRQLRDGSVAPDADWTDAEHAAWSLYAPIAASRGETPFLLAQVGQSLDGRVATITGDAADISGMEGLKHLHRCRALCDAVVIGVRTALTDDPQLTVRLVPGQSPARVVIDPRGRLPNSARVLADDGVRRIVVQAVDTDRPEGVEVIRLRASERWISPEAIRTALFDAGFGSMLIEGGGVTIAGFLEAGLLNRLHVAVAPLIIGAGPAGLRTAPIAQLSDALRPETSIYGLETDVVFDCALVAPGSARTSRWPTVQAEVETAKRRTLAQSSAQATPVSAAAASMPDTSSA